MNRIAGAFRPALALAACASAATLAVLTFAVPTLYAARHAGEYASYVRAAFSLGGGLGLISALLPQALWARIVGASAVAASVVLVVVVSLRF